MSFFEGRPFEPPPEPERPPTPAWFGPPDATIGGYLAERLVLFRSETVVMVIDGFRCFPTGVLFDKQLWMRGDALSDPHGSWGPPWERQHPGRPGSDAIPPEPALRFGVAFSDGSSWSNLDVNDRTDLMSEPPRPQVWHLGGGGGGDHWRFGAWLWPLPPAGPVRFVAEWPAQGVPETVAEIDGARLREAAERAETLWS